MHKTCTNQSIDQRYKSCRTENTIAVDTLSGTTYLPTYLGK